jgi:tetratricopeptide (TPR) repeat protein
VEASENYLDITNYKEKLGLILCCQYKYSEGLGLLLQVLKRLETRSYLKRIMECSWNLSNAYYEIKQFQIARKYYNKALKISNKLNIPLAKEFQGLLSKIEEAETNEV